VEKNRKTGLRLKGGGSCFGSGFYERTQRRGKKPQRGGKHSGGENYCREKKGVKKSQRIKEKAHFEKEGVLEK